MSTEKSKKSRVKGTLAISFIFFYVHIWMFFHLFCFLCEATPWFGLIFAQNCRPIQGGSCTNSLRRVADFPNNSLSTCRDSGAPCIGLDRRIQFSGEIAEVITSRMKNMSAQKINFVQYGKDHCSQNWTHTFYIGDLIRPSPNYEMQIVWSRLSKLSSPIWMNFATFQIYFYLVSTKIFICEITIFNSYSWQYDHYLQISTGPLCLKVIDSKAAPCPQLRIKSSSSWNAERWSEPSSQNTQVQQPLDQIVNSEFDLSWHMDDDIVVVLYLFFSTAPIILRPSRPWTPLWSADPQCLPPFLGQS